MGLKAENLQDEHNETTSSKIKATVGDFIDIYAIDSVK